MHVLAYEIGWPGNAEDKYRSWSPGAPSTADVDAGGETGSGAMALLQVQRGDE